MNCQSIKYWFSLSLGVVLLSFIIAGCGQRSAPTGGKKDVTPPRVLKRSPDSLQTNYTDKVIRLQFDEYFKVAGFNNEFLISPPIEGKPSYKVLGKKLVIKFDSAFAPNTTYSVFLGKAIKDLNEGNPLQNNMIVFSTGDVIDSLSFAGRTVNAKNMEDFSEGMVHLYKSIEDSVPAKMIPSYFAKITGGRFEFKNIAAGTYKLFALKDNNSNYKYDLPTELVAFNDDPIVLTANDAPDSLVLKMFDGSIPKQYIKETKVDFKGKLYVKFNQSVKDFELVDILGSDSTQQFFYQWNEKMDSLIYWSTSMLEKDSIYFEVKFNGLKDTIKQNIKSRKKMTEQKLYVSTSFPATNHHHLKEKAFVFSQPITSYDQSKVFLLTEKDTIPAELSQSDSDAFSVEINNALQPETPYTFKILPNAFESVFNMTNEDTLKRNCMTASKTSWGNLILNCDFSAIPSEGILQVFHAGELEHEQVVHGNTQIVLKGIHPGAYKLKFIKDDNNDGAWTTGDYWEKRQPEQVFWYKEPINLRANWDLEVNWILNPK